MSTLTIVRWTVGPFMENSYLVYDAHRKEGIMIDPGDQEEILIRGIDDRGIRLSCIVNTHGHIDHIGAVAALKKRFGIPFLIHSNDAELVQNAPYFARIIGLPIYPVEIPTIDGYIKHGDTITVGTFEARVIETPGHTAGGVCLHFESEKVLFSGDTLFRGSVGRTDFPGADYETLISSIREKLWTLPDDTVVYPGHGEPTTIGLEKRFNPFAGEPAHS